MNFNWTLFELYNGVWPGKIKNHPVNKYKNSNINIALFFAVLQLQENLLQKLAVWANWHKKY